MEWNWLYKRDIERNGDREEVILLLIMLFLYMFVNLIK